MKKIVQVLLFINIVFWAACSNNEPEMEDIIPIRASLIYDFDTVVNYIKTVGDKYKSIADNYLTKANEQEEINIKKAIWNLKRAITIYPNLDSYKKLGQLLLKDKQFNEAVNLFEFISWKKSEKVDNNWVDYYVFEAPSEETFLNLMISSFLAYNSLPYDVFDMASELNFSLPKLKDQFFENPLVVCDKESLTYKTLQLYFLTDEERESYGTNAENFTAMLKRINNTPQFQVDLNSVSDFDYANFNGMNFDYETPSLVHVENMFLKESRDHKGEFSNYNFLNAFKLNDSITVLHYAIDSSETACPKDMRHIYHVLATYDNAVNIIDYKIVASQSAEITGEFSFDNGTVVCKEYKRNWKEKYNKTEFDNELLNTKIEKVNSFKISNQGKFEPIVLTN